MISLKNSIPIMVMVIILLLLTACDLLSSRSQDYGACKEDITDLLEFHEERGFARIILYLKMEEFVPESELDEEQREEQSKAITELQDKFLLILEENEIKIEALRKGSQSPWMGMHVYGKDGLLFICRHDMVERVSKARLMYTQ